MWRVLSLILFLILGIVLMATDWLIDIDGPVDLASFIFGIALAASIGYIVFSLRVWSEGSRAVFRGRPASLKDSPSAFRVLLDSILSSLRMIGVIVAAVVTGLEYEGRHDLVTQALDFIVTKMGKLVNALMH